MVRHQPRALLQHLRDGGIVEVEPVLDRVASTVERAVQTDPAICMARHLALLPWASSVTP